MKVFIDRDEWYPVYSFFNDSRFGYEIDIDENIWNRYKKVEQEFDILQNLMSKIYKEAHTNYLQKESEKVNV